MNVRRIRLAAFIAAAFGGAGFGASAADMAKGRQMFLQGTTPACAVCHTLQDAGASGEIGPNLDELKPDADRVAIAVRQGLGAMPPFKDLSDAEVRLLAEYVAAATK
jgi:sulfite dehydrogenase